MDWTVSFWVANDTAITSRLTRSGASMANHWAIIPPWETPMTRASWLPSRSMASAKSLAMSRVVVPDSRTSLRLKIQTRYSRA